MAPSDPLPTAEQYAEDSLAPEPCDTAASLQHALAGCRQQIATCRKLLDGLTTLLTQTRTPKSYQNCCAARDALGRTLVRLENQAAHYDAYLKNTHPSEELAADIPAGQK